ncbi:GEVED domain-containing protein [Taibaiella soli]|nr:GEVED domain-containing protein [Taibaiella soli]
MILLLLAVVSTPRKASAYCTTGLGGASYADIDSVSIVGTTLANYSPGYASSFYTAYPASGNTTATLLPGSTYTLYASFNGSPNTAIASLWIDYNQNGTFEASEWVQICTNAATATVSFTVPATASIGTTGMRVRSRGNGNTNGSGDACSSFGSGETEDYTITIASPTPCSGAPTAGTASATVDSACLGIPFNVSLSGATIAGNVTYQWFSSPHGTNTFAAITGATNTSYTVANQTAGTDYRCKVKCNNTNDSVLSNIVWVGQNSPSQCYCTPTAGASSTSYYFNNITTTGGVTNMSYTATSFVGYNDRYNTISFSQNAGSPVNISLGVAGGGTYFYYCWVDWNQNGSFADPGETIFATTTYTSSPFTSTIPIALTQPGGNYRMRIAQSYIGAVPPCGPAPYGNYVDVKLTVIPLPPCTGMPTAGTASASVDSACVNVPFNLTLTGMTTAGGITYQWSSSPHGANTYANISGASTVIYTVANQTASTDYRCVIKCTNTGDSIISNIVWVGQNTPSQCYCIPTGGSSSTSFYLNNITTTGAMANMSYTAGAYQAYDDKYNAISFSQIAGQNVNVSLGVAGGSTYYYYCWVDWNQNGSFADPGETIFATSSYMSTPYTDVIPINANQAGGNYRVRFAQSYIGTIPICGPAPYGNYVDVKLTVIPLTPCNQPVAGTVTPVTPCANNDFNLSVTGNALAAGITYQWQQSANGTSGWTSAGITNATQIPATANISQPTYFRMIATCNNTNLSDTTAAYTVQLAPFYFCYCNSAAATNYDDDIGNVTVISQPANDTLLNNGIASPLVPNATSINTYTDFRQSVAPVPLFRDSTYYLSVTQIDQSYFYACTAVAFIDYNRDGIFQTSENVFQQVTAATTQMVSATFTVPDTAQIGITGLRVILSEQTSGSINPCGTNTYSYGETEDYLANINMPPCDGPANPGIAWCTDTAMCTDYTFQLTDTTHERFKSGLTWVWQQTTNNGSSWTDIPNSTGQDTLSLVFTAQSSYRLKMSCSNTNDVTYSNAVSINIKPPYKCYCYSTANGGAADTSDISSFSIGDFVVTTGGPHIMNPQATRGRTDYTDLGPIELYSDSTYPLSFYHTLRGTVDADARVTMFMDFNNNLVYDIPAERITLSNDVSTPGNWYLIDSVTIPEAIIPDVPTGMRIIINNNVGPNTPSDDACGPYTSGETEDYTVIFRKANPLSAGNIINMKDLMIYPNPTTGKFAISFSAASILHNLQIRVTNVTGQQIIMRSYGDNIKQFHEELDMTEQAKGVYFVEFTADGQKLVRKLVVR